MLRMNSSSNVIVKQRRIILFVLIIAAVIFVAWFVSVNRTAAPVQQSTVPQLTDAQKQAALQSLNSNPSAPLSNSAKSKTISRIQKAGTPSTGTSSLTAAQKAAALKALTEQ